MVYIICNNVFIYSSIRDDADLHGFDWVKLKPVFMSLLEADKNSYGELPFRDIVFVFLRHKVSLLKSNNDTVLFQLYSKCHES